MPEWLTAELIWFVVGIFLLVSEFVLPGLVVGFFGMGALVTALVVKLRLVRNTGIEIVICTVVSVVLLLVLRRYIKHWFLGFTAGKGDLRSTRDEYVGRRVEVIEKIVPNSNQGRVSIDGTPWKADADEVVEAGTLVQIVERKGLSVKVKGI